MKKLLVITSFLLVSFLLSGQNARPDSLFLFSGYALYAVDSVAVPYVHVLNINRGTGTVSAIDGSFELYVRDADTLKFSCIGLHDHYIRSQALLLQPNMLVFLSPDTIMMKELRISPLPPRRFFRNVFLETRLPKEEMKELNLGPLIKRDPGNVPPVGIHATGPTQLLYDAFNKKARLSRKLRRNRDKYSKYIVPVTADSLVYPNK